MIKWTNLGILLMLLPMFPCISMQEKRVVDAERALGNTGTTLEMRAFLCLAEQFMAMEGDDREQAIKHVATTLPDDLFARFLGCYLLNRHELRASLDYASSCIKLANYFAQKTIAMVHEKTKEAGEMLIDDKAKAAYLFERSGDYRLEKARVKKQKKFNGDQAVDGHFATVHAIIKSTMNNYLYTDRARLQPLSVACIQNASLIVELLVRHYCDVPCIVSSLEQLICLDDERPACLLLDVLMTTDVAKAFNYEDGKSLCNHTAFFNRPTLRAKLSLFFERAAITMLKEGMAMQTTSEGQVRLDPETERALYAGTFDVSYVMEMVAKSKKRWSDVRIWIASTEPSQTLLFLAAHKGFTQLAAWLLNREEWGPQVLREAFLEACERGHAEVIKLFFDKFPKLFDLSRIKEFDKALGGDLALAVVGNKQILKLFTRQFLNDLNVNWEYAAELLEMASWHGYPKSVKQLLPSIALIADPELRLDILSQCLESACNNSYEQSARYLLDAGAPANRRVCNLRGVPETFHPLCTAIGADRDTNDEEKATFVEYILDKSGAPIIASEMIEQLDSKSIRIEDLLAVHTVLVKRAPKLMQEIMYSRTVSIENRYELLTRLHSLYRERLSSLIRYAVDIDDLLAKAQDDYEFEKNDEDYDGKEGELVQFLQALKR